MIDVIDMRAPHAAPQDAPPLGVCEVCLWVDDDRTVKPVRWCGMCQAWLCEPCSQQLARRAVAMMRRAKAGALVRFLKGLGW